MTTAEHFRPVALITGASGGLGRALVAEFAKQGWRVCAACRCDVFETDDRNIWPVQMDVTQTDQIATVVAQLLARWGRVDALVNNAGVTDDASCWQARTAAWERVLEVNLKGAFLCSRAVMKPMMQQRDGHILNVSSLAARSGPAGQSSYAAAKAGLIGLTQSLAKEVATDNVRVNAILPGVMPTGMTAKLTPAQLKSLTMANLLNRMNDVDEVARFMAFVATMKNVSGQVFQLDSRAVRWN